MHTNAHLWEKLVEIEKLLAYLILVKDSDWFAEELRGATTRKDAFSDFRSDWEITLQEVEEIFG